MEGLDKIILLSVYIVWKIHSVMKKLEKIHEVKGEKLLFKMETSDDHRDYMKYESLRNEVWGEPNDNLPASRNMKCENYFHDGSSLFIGVFAADEFGNFEQDKEHLVGFSYGYVGVNNKEIAFKALDNIQFYSQYTCVRKDFQHVGLGILIKEFQRENLMEVFGIYTTTCTFDPLTGVNAYRNIHHFGMDVVKYIASYYGEFGGLLNRRDIPTDRFFLSWDLRKKNQPPDYDLESLIGSGSTVVQTGTKMVKGRNGILELEVVEKLSLNLDQEFLLVEIPFDFYRMLRETDVSESKTRCIPLEWRMKIRKAFKRLLERKYKIVDFRKIEEKNRKRSFYVLKKISP